MAVTVSCGPREATGSLQVNPQPAKSLVQTREAHVGLPNPIQEIGFGGGGL